MSEHDPLFHRSDLGTERAAARRTKKKADRIRDLAKMIMNGRGHGGLTNGELVNAWRLQADDYRTPEHGIRPRLTECTDKKWGGDYVKTRHTRPNDRDNPEAVYMRRACVMDCCGVSARRPCTIAEDRDLETLIEHPNPDVFHPDSDVGPDDDRCPECGHFHVARYEEGPN